MLEAAAFPLLMKAIDFLFDEGRRILQERGERKAAYQQEGDTMAISSDLANSSQQQWNTDQPAPDVIDTKEDILRHQISQATWTTHEKEIRHLLSLLEVYQKNYWLAKEQHARWGIELVPSIVVHRLEEAENNVAETMTKLCSRLSIVAGKPIVIAELQGGNEQ
jgi:hypothetical protein